MRGAVVVDDPMAGVIDVSTTAVVAGAGVLGAALSPFAFGAFLALRGTGDDIPPDTASPIE